MLVSAGRCLVLSTTRQGCVTNSRSVFEGGHRANRGEVAHVCEVVSASPGGRCSGVRRAMRSSTPDAWRDLRVSLTDRRDTRCSCAPEGLDWLLTESDGRRGRASCALASSGSRSRQVRFTGGSPSLPGLEGHPANSAMRDEGNPGPGPHDERARLAKPGPGPEGHGPEPCRLILWTPSARWRSPADRLSGEPGGQRARPRHYRPIRSA